MKFVTRVSQICDKSITKVLQKYYKRLKKETKAKKKVFLHVVYTQVTQIHE